MLKNNLILDLSDDQISIVAEQQNSVVSKELIIAATSYEIIPEAMDVTSSIMNYLVKRTDVNQTRNFNFNTDNVTGDSGIDITASNVKLLDRGEIGIDLSLGGVVKALANKVYKYENDDIYVLAYGDYNYGTRMANFFVKPGARDTTKYISIANTGSTFLMALKLPRVITKMRIFPYSIKNTVSSFYVKAFGPDGNLLYSQLYNSPVLQPGTSWDGYKEIIINDIVANIVISFQDTSSSVSSSFGGIELFTNDIAPIGEVTTKELMFSYENIKRMANINIASTNITKHNKARFTINVDKKSMIFKPKEYTVPYTEFESVNGLPVLYGTKLKKYGWFTDNIFTDTDYMSSILIGNRPTVTMPIESWVCTRDVGDYTWADGGNDALDGWGSPQLYYNGVWQSIFMKPGTYTYNNNGLDYKITSAFVSQNLYRMTLEGITNFRAPIQFQAGGNMGSDATPHLTQSTYDINGKTYELYYSWDGAGEPDTYWSIIPSDPLKSGIPYATASADNVYLYSGAVELPITVYMYIGFASAADVVAGIKYDIANSVASYGFGWDNGTAYGTMLATITAECVFTPTLIKKVCTKGWDYFKIIGLDQSIENVRYLISFDEENSWKYYEDNIWKTASFGAIPSKGMTKDNIFNIPAEAYKLLLGSYVSIAVITMGDGYFNGMTIDSGLDKLLPIANIDIANYGMTKDMLDTMDTTFILGEFKPQEYSMKLGFTAHMQNINGSVPIITSISGDTLQKIYWTTPTVVEQNNISVKMFDQYTEVHNLSAQTINLKFNYMKPRNLTLIDKESGENLKDIANMIDIYKKEDNIIYDIVNKAKKSLGFYNYSVNENSLAMSKILVSLYTRDSFNYSGENIYVNGLSTNNMLVVAPGGYSYNGTLDKYVISPSAALTKITSDLFLPPISETSGMYVLDNASSIPEKTFVILNEEYEVEVINNTIDFTEI